MTKGKTTMYGFPNLAIEELQRRIRKAGSQKAVADQLGIQQSQLSEVLSGRRDVSDTILEKIGFTRIETFVKADDAERFLRAMAPTIEVMRGVKRLEKAVANHIKQVAKS